MKNKIRLNFLKVPSLKHFLIIGPIIDLITSLMVYYNISTFTLGMFIRTLYMVLLFCFFALSKDDKQKKPISYFISVIVFYMLLYTVNIYISKGSTFIISEIKPLLKTFYFPLFLLLSFSIIKSEERKKTDYIKLFKNIFYLYLLFLIVPYILNISFNTYDWGKQGFIGWFYSPNEISAILAILFPFVFYDLFYNKKTILSYFVFAVISYVMLNIGTKVPFLAIFSTLISYYVINMINIFSDKEKIKSIKDFVKLFVINKITICLLVLVCIFTFSNLKNNVNYHKTQLLTQNENEKLSQDDYLNLIFSSRDSYVSILRDKFKLANLNEQLFGLGFEDINKKFNKQYNIVEIDYGDVFFIYGVIGFVVYFIFAFLLIVDGIIISLKKFKNIISNYQIMSFYISLTLAFFIALFAGHVFTAPSVSIYPAIILPLVFSKISRKKSILRKLLKFIKINIKYFFIITCLLLLFLFYLGFKITPKIADVKLSIKNNTLEESTHLKLKQKTVKSDTIDLGVIDTTTIYNYHKGKVFLELKLVEREISNYGKILFWNIGNHTDYKVNVELNYTDNSFNYTNHAITYFKERENSKDYNTTVGYDKISLPLGYLEFDDKKSMIISKGFIFNNMYTNYVSGEFSFVKNLISEDEKINVLSNKIVYNFSLNSNDYYEGYLITSQQLLLNNQKDLNTYIELLNNSNYRSWISYDGSYHKLPYSIEPYSTEAYGRNPGSVIAKSFLYNLNNESPLFKVLSIHSLYSLFNYLPRDSTGVWLTEYTSTCLQKDYKIRAPYVDTRHNENISNFLYSTKKYLNNEKIFNAGFVYADYLLEKYSKRDIINYSEGFLFPDYFSDNHTKKTHASLNHQLSIINYLFRSYLLSKNEKYKTLASELLTTIDNMSDLWIRDNFDTWYQVNSLKEFDGNDYTLLTLEDLIYTQEYLELIGERKNKNINKLLKSKYQYLKSIDYNIPTDLIKRMNRVIY